MAKVKEELLGSVGKQSLTATVARYILLILLIVGLGVYIGLMLFGTNSVEALYELNVREKNLKRSIKFLKQENARLQKEYFELKELEPQE